MRKLLVSALITTTTLFTAASVQAGPVMEPGNFTTVTSTGTSRLISVNATQQVKAQACNEGGCGLDSIAVTATYCPYCM